MSNKTWWTIFIVIFLDLGTLNTYSQFLDSPENRNTLRGIPGVYVSAQLDPDLGVTKEQIQTDVELRLRTAGIKVLSKEEYFETPGGPHLFVEVNTINSQDITEIYFFFIAVRLFQHVSLERNPFIKVRTPTWSYGTIGIVSIRNPSHVRDFVKDTVDHFINAYLAVNPKK